MVLRMSAVLDSQLNESEPMMGLLFDSNSNKIERRAAKVVVPSEEKLPRNRLMVEDAEDWNNQIAIKYNSKQLVQGSQQTQILLPETATSTGFV